MINKIILIVFLSSFQACKQSRPTVSNELNVLSFDTTSITIINVNPSAKNAVYKIKAATLSQDDINKLENFMRLALNDLNEITEKMRKSDSILNPSRRMSKRFYKCELQDLKRQYIPFTNDKGEKVVLVICFKTDTAVERYYRVWKTEPYPSNYGGHHAFRFVVNLSRSDYSRIQLNGAG